MKCHYDVLGVPRDSNDTEIKKSYRKLALQLHPDKNPENVEECTKQFLVIQQAYEVLIDPQERAWYDKHREAILRGGQGHGDDYQDNRLDVYQYFNSSCYCGFGDDEKGFYAVYSEVFTKLSLEDLEYKSDMDAAPEFGNSLSTYEETVGPFYAYWESYNTAKSFVWVEKYDTREAPNRQIRRLMEQDNKKLRDKARRERNEEVRELVSYIRKRDRRVQAYKKKLEERAVEIARLAEERKNRDREQRIKKMENYKESSWSSMSELERQLKQLELNVAQQFGDEDSYDESDVEESSALQADGDAGEVLAADAAVETTNVEDDDDDYYNSLYCIACKKAFKSEKALDNHNRSRKHMENVYLLQSEMADDDKLLETAQDEVDLSEEDDQEEVEIINTSKSKSKKQRKKRRQQLKVQALVESDEENQQTELEAGEVLENAAEDLKVGEIEERLQSSVGEEKSVSEDKISDSMSASTSKNGEEIGVNELSRKPKSRKPAKSYDEMNTCKPSHVNGEPSSSDTQLFCNKCRKVFTSRNKLFDHIKQTGHALHIDTESIDNDLINNSSSKSKSKKGKRK